MNQISLAGLIYQVAYQLHRHALFGWTLTRWLAMGLIAIPLLISFGVLPLGQPAAVIAGIIAVTYLFALWLIKRRGYVRFVPLTSVAPASTPAPLSYPDTVEVHVSGNLAVGGNTRYFVKATAQYQTFETRERVIMAQIPQTRLLLLARSPEPEIGWWYAFFNPETIIAVKSGKLLFGLHPKPALQLTYRPEEADSPERLTLAFNSAEAQSRILADLHADGIAVDIAPAS